MDGADADRPELDMLQILQGYTTLLPSRVSINFVEAHSSPRAVRVLTCDDERRAKRESAVRRPACISVSAGVMVLMELGVCVAAGGALKAMAEVRSQQDGNVIHSYADPGTF